MKKLIAALALTTAAIAAPAFSAVGVSISIGEPGFYGQLDIGGYQPRLPLSGPRGRLSPVRNAGTGLPARPAVAVT